MYFYMHPITRANLCKELALDPSGKTKQTYIDMGDSYENHFSGVRGDRSPPRDAGEVRAFGQQQLFFRPLFGQEVTPPRGGSLPARKGGKKTDLYYFANYTV